MWDALALCANRGEAADAVREKALTFLQSAAEGESTEWYAAMLLVENACGDDAGRTRRAGELMALQNPDGGWGWRVEDESDALATGEALYALASTIEAGTSPEAARAAQWLVDHQRDDGSWEVRGTKDKKRDSVEETAVYMGTCWGVLGLLETLPGTDAEADRGN
jgi:prenyltransferase beta subunit